MTDEPQVTVLTDAEAIAMRRLHTTRSIECGAMTTHLMCSGCDGAAMDGGGPCLHDCHSVTLDDAADDALLDLNALTPPASDRQPAYDAVYALIRGLGDRMPAEPVHRNAMIWRAVSAALDASGSDRAAGWIAGVRWAAAEADAQAAGREPVAMIDVTDHLRACASDPQRRSAVDRSEAPADYPDDVGEIGPTGILDKALADMIAQAETRGRAKAAEIGVDPSFILRVLNVFAMFPNDSNDMLLWRTDGKWAPLTFMVNCSDFFHWGTADCETIERGDVEALERAFADVQAAGDEGQYWGAVLFCARKRGMRPQGPAYPKTPALVALFDACGPERLDSPKRPAGQDGGDRA